MAKLINNFLSKLPSLQTQRILSTLSAKQQTGEITAVDEYNKALRGIVNTKYSKIAPLHNFKDFLPNTIISSDQLNELLTWIDNDGRVLSGELDYLYQALNAHKNVFQQHILNAMTAGVESLKTLVTQYELIFRDKRTLGTTEVSINNFSADTVGGAEVYASELFRDPRTSNTLTDRNEIDVASGTLGLPRVIQSAPFKSVKNLAGVTGGYLATPICDETIPTLASGGYLPADTIVVFEVANVPLDKTLPVTFSDSTVFVKEVFSLPENPGEYVIVYDSTDLNTYSFASAVGQIFLYVLADVEDPGTISYSYVVRNLAGTLSVRNAQSFDIDINFVLKDDDKYWMNVVHADEVNVLGATTKIALHFEGLRNINSFEVQPVTDYPVILDQVAYIAPSGNLVLLQDQQSARLYKPHKLFFKEVSALGIVLTLRQDNHEWKVYKLRQEDHGIKELVNTSGAPQETIDFLLDRVVSHPQLRSLISSDSQSKDTFTTVQYLTGLEFATCERSTYRDVGIFVANPLTEVHPGLLTLYTDEVYPENDCETNVPSSFEYYILQKDFNPEGSLISSRFAPILPVGQMAIGADGYDRERVYFDRFNFTATTRFRAHGFRSITELGGSTPSYFTLCGLTLFRDGVELTRGSGVGDKDWYVSNSTADSDGDPYTLIKLNTSLADELYQLETSIFTVAYTPLYLVQVSGGLKVCEVSSTYSTDGTPIYLDGNFRTGAIKPTVSNAIEMPVIHNGIVSAKSLIWFITILRINDRFVRDRSPRLNHYKLGISLVSPNKFRGL